MAILAGGLGTRLQPAVYGIPKSMAPIDDKPFLEYQLIHLKERGFTNILLLVGYLGDMVVDRFGDGSSLGLSISYSREDEPLGTAGAVKAAERLLNDRFMLLNGDTFLDVDYRHLLEFHERIDSLLTVSLVAVDDVSRYGAVHADESGHIVSFSEKATSGPGFINGGVYVLEKNVLDRIDARRKVSLENEVIPGLIAAGEPVYGMIAEGYFIDIGTPESYNLAKRYFTGG